MIPSYITTDPDCEIDEPILNPRVRALSDEDEDAETDSGSQSGQSAFVLAPAARKFKELQKEARQLDAVLYNVLKLNVKGSKSSLLSCVMYPSYVQAICVLHKHIDISRNDRETKAFMALDKLEFKGDVQVYQITAMKLIQELLDSKCTIMDYILMRVMRSFDGKSKTIQYKIADDINNKVVDENLNVFDLIQSYCSDMASMGDNKLNVVKNVKCTLCKKTGHEKKDCFKAKKGGKGKAQERARVVAKLTPAAPTALFLKLQVGSRGPALHVERVATSPQNAQTPRLREGLHPRA